MMDKLPYLELAERVVKTQHSLGLLKDGYSLETIVSAAEKLYAFNQAPVAPSGAAKVEKRKYVKKSLNT